MPEKSETVYFTDRRYSYAVHSGELVLKEGQDLVVRREDGRLIITHEECIASVDEYEESIRKQKCEVICDHLSNHKVYTRIKMETLDAVLDELVSVREEIKGGDNG